MSIDFWKQMKTFEKPGKNDKIRSYLRKYDLWYNDVYFWIAVIIKIILHKLTWIPQDQQTFGE